GRRYDSSLLAELPPGVDPCGERGEFHTFCFAGPMFRHPIAIESGVIVDRDGFVFADVLPPRLPVSAPPSLNGPCTARPTCRVFPRPTARAPSRPATSCGPSSGALQRNHPA